MMSDGSGEEDRFYSIILKLEHTSCRVCDVNCLAAPPLAATFSFDDPKKNCDPGTRPFAC